MRAKFYLANVPRQRHPAVGATDAREAELASGVPAGGCSLHESVRIILFLDSGHKGLEHAPEGFSSRSFPQ